MSERTSRASTSAGVLHLAGLAAAGAGVIHAAAAGSHSGDRVVVVVVNGRCRPGGTRGQAAPMLHVWVVPNDCGPFAGTDRRQASGSCVAPEALDS